VGYRPYFENYTVDASILNLNPSGSNYKDLFIDHWSISTGSLRVVGS
jgi:hypothetical protein